MENREAKQRSAVSILDSVVQARSAKRWGLNEYEFLFQLERNGFTIPASFPTPSEGDAMILACLCGRRFRTSEETPARNRACPQCGGPLNPEQDVLAPAIDLNVLIEQMKVLRDELVTRDRALRRAQAETTLLRAELEQLRSRTSSA